MTNEIKIPTGYEFSHVEGDKVVLKVIRQKVRKWEEQENLEGFHIDELSQIVNYSPMFRLNINKNTFHTEKQALAAIALAKLTQSLVDLKQEPIIWDGAKTYFCIGLFYLYKELGLRICSYSSTLQFLAFHDSEIRDEFLEVHREDIIAAAPLLWGVEIGGKNE